MIRMKSRRTDPRATHAEINQQDPLNSSHICCLPIFGGDLWRKDGLTMVCIYIYMGPLLEIILLQVLLLLAVWPKNREQGKLTKRLTSFTGGWG